MTVAYESHLPGELLYIYSVGLTDERGEPIRKDDVGLLAADIAADRRFRPNDKAPRDKSEYEKLINTDGDLKQKRAFDQLWDEAQAYGETLSPDRAGSLVKQSLDDYGNGQRLVEYFGDRLKFAEDTGTWFAWDGRHWEKDPRGLIARFLTHKTMVEFHRQARELPDVTGATGKPLENPVLKFSYKCFTSKAIGCALTEAAPYLRIKTEVFDADPWVLNVENGIVDLRAGTLPPRDPKRLLPHDPERLLTKLAPVKFDPKATCPTWDKFLSETFDPDLLKFVDRATGYSLSGNTRDKCLFLLHGKTDTGKTTFLETLHDVMGDYATRIGVETIMAKTRDSTQQEDIADLAGTRMVITSETEDGQRLAEALVKRHTQGQGKIKACRKYEHPIMFRETHKLWLDSNHLPMIHGTDDSIWGRLMPIPAEHQVEKKDRDLPEKLREEFPGILARAVRGCLEWQRDGLGEPRGVEAMRKEYRKKCDLIGLFLEETTEENMNAFETTARLYLAYYLWAKESGEYVMTKRAFGMKLSERTDVRGAKESHERGWRGRHLLPVSEGRVKAFLKAREKGEKG